MLNLERFNEEIWFDWPDAEGVRLKIKPCSRKDLLDLRSKVKRKMGISIEGRTEIVDDYNEADFLWGMFTLCLQKWEGINFGGKNPTKESMLTAIFNHDGLREFVFQKARESSTMLENKLEEELKNSDSSQNGSPNSQG